MNGYQDLTTNIENSRNCLRRIARNDDQEFSRESIVNLMEKFVKTVNVMDETILVPCRLLDRSVGDATDTVPDTLKIQHHSSNKKKGTSVHEKLNAAELFNLYTMLNGVKTDLLWGRNSEEQPEEIQNKMAQQQQNDNANATETKETTKGHVRRPSTASVASSNSTNTLSDTESELSNENDSGIESESHQENDKSTELARQYRTHLLGLYRCLEQMTDAANYLTARYQSDVGPV